MKRAALGLTAIILAACAPGAPKGVDKAVLDQAVADAIGDPGTCVLIRDGDKTVYRYGTNVICGRSLPSCETAAVQTLDALLKTAPTTGEPRTASCRSNPERTRVVAWASGPISGTSLAYAAVMEGDEIPPGVVIADKLNGAFAKAGVSKPSS